MTPEPASPAWTLPGWDKRAHAWIDDRLEALGRPLTGPIVDYHRRPWSAVLIAPTAAGKMYFKAGAPYLSNEAALIPFLYAARPDCIVQPLAADPQRRWLLLEDEGERLREVLRTPADVRLLERILPVFAELQIEMLPRRAALIALGLEDHRLERLPEMFAALLADPAMLRLGLEDGLTPDQHDRLRAILPYYAEMCARLAEFPIAETLHHDDFHDGNIFHRSGRFTFSDWGDSSLAHPFFSVVISLRSAADRLGLPDEATESPERLPAELERLRDAYLEPWQKFAPLPELRRIFPIAWRAGMVNRSLGWAHELRHEDAAGRAENGYTVPAWLSEFLLAL